MSRTGSAVPCSRASAEIRCSVATARGQASGSGKTQCAPLVTSAKSTGHIAGPTPNARFSALLTSTSDVPMTIAGRCRSSRQSRPNDSAQMPIATCSATSSAIAELIEPAANLGDDRRDVAALRQHVDKPPGRRPVHPARCAPVASWNVSAKLITPRLCYKTADPASG